MGISVSTLVAPWKIACLLRISGADAETFLQGQFTNDLRALKIDGAVYGLWLNQKGKVLADSFILRGPASGEFFVASYFSGVAEVRRRLEDYIIADDVMIDDLTDEWSGVSIIGTATEAWLSDAKKMGRIFPGRRTRSENWEWIFPKAEAKAVATQLAGVREIDAEALAVLRVQAEIPAVPFDLGPGDLPAEGGLDIDAISYTKGCYLGQEVMARLKSMGQVRRRLLGARGRGKAPAVPAKLKQGEKSIGELRTAVANGEGFLGLAMISLVNLRNDSPVSLEGDASSILEMMPPTP